MKKHIVIATFSLILASCAGSRPEARSSHALPAEAIRQIDGSVTSEELSRYRPVVGTKGMVVADDRVAAEWGAEILRQGGNAIDAAVATAFAMAVTRPQFASLGGGGFLLYCPAPKNGPVPCHAIDYRERAPKSATRDMYLRDGKAAPKLSQDGALASGIPGVPAGLLQALEAYGTRSRGLLLTRAIALAKNGIQVSGYTEFAANERWPEMNPDAKRIFGCGKDRACPAGTLLKQPELARVLTEIAGKGSAGFYEGWVARKISDGIRKAGGLITEEDLAAYKPVERTPLVTRFHGMEVELMPLPSSGGLALAQMLGYVERADKTGALRYGPGSPRTIHALAHAMALAFADRAHYLGDPDFVKVPVNELTSAAYLDRRWETFRPEHAELPAGPGSILPEPRHTTHFSVIDGDGNAVAVTTTVNDNFGSAFVPPGTGVVMNNEMDDFSAQPGAPNLFGLVGAEANAIAPGKHPLSSMSPTIVRDADGRARIIVGAAGGPRIITSVFLTLVNRLEFGMSLVDAVTAPRFHQQWKPELLVLEKFGFPAETRRDLAELGYSEKETSALARQHALERFANGRVWGVPDFRAEGAAVAE